MEYRFRHKNGDYIWVLSRGRALHDENGIVTRSLGSHTDISARKRSEEKLVFDALHDKLTGLPNRTLFNERLSRVIKRTRKDPSFLFAVLFLDLDNFKNVNDSMGHESGDELLKLFASRIQNILFDVDTLARLGGDEFALLVESLDSQQRPVEIAQRIRASLKNPFTVLDRDLYLTASIGVVIYSEEYSTSEEILRDADIAMYHAKNMGRDTVEIFNSAMRERIMRRLNLERDLRQAVARNEFYIEYQPIVDLKTSKLLAFEALLRWHHPQRGLIPPEEFIPIAEQTGLIIPIGEWVFQAACAQMKRWDRLHDYMQKVSINVNVSGKQLNRPDFPSTVTRILDATSLDPARLNIEITETVILEDNPYTFDALTSLSKLGIRFHLDDFGKGQSYLGYLQKYPLSQIKIDRSFVANLPNAKEHDLIHGIIQLAKALDMETVAEGIESKDQEAVLKYLQCDSGQGFGISVPIPADEVDKLIREQSTMAPFRFSVK
ncbi:MAG: EAL domain-containing protein [Chloroflexi bacterium]|nr:EAL domain-containing protein [Chloroflexota bacterium]